MVLYLIQKKILILCKYGLKIIRIIKIIIIIIKKQKKDIFKNTLFDYIYYINVLEIIIGYIIN